MIKTLLITMAMAATVNAQPAPQIVTAYTPDGAQVQLISTDPSTHDDDKILTMDDSAEIYISMERGNGAYTLYTLQADGIHEIWFYGYGTETWTDDIAADWQVWDFPTIDNTIQF